MSEQGGSKKTGTAFGALAAIGVILAKSKGALLLALKGGGIFLKLGWILKGSLSLFLSLGVYAMAFGWKYAIMVIGLLVLHELGHYIWMKSYGLNPKLPVFVPFMGAYVQMTKMPGDEATHAWVAYAGPFIGGLGALAFYFLGQVTDNAWLVAGASFGFFLNLMQLIPAKPLDGGFIVGSISRKFLIVGTIMLVILAFITHSVLLVIISVISVISLFRNRKATTANAARHSSAVPIPPASFPGGNSTSDPYDRTEPAPATTMQRWQIGTAYIVLAGLLAFFYSDSQTMMAEHFKIKSSSSWLRDKNN